MQRLFMPDNRGVGVLGVVECNFLQPTHNKQDFLDTKVYRSLIQALGNKLNDYWNEKKGVTHNVDGSYMVKPEPADQTDANWLQCDRCNKWRKLPLKANMAALERIKAWFCEMNPDPSHSKCEIEEEPEDPDEVRPSYEKTFKKRQQAAEFQRKAIEVTRKIQKRSKINEEKKKMREEKARLEKMQMELALQREAKKEMEMHKKLPCATETGADAGSDSQPSEEGHQDLKTMAYDDDDDEMQIVKDDDPEPPPASQGQPGPIPLKIAKVNQGSLKRREPPMSQPVVPAKRERGNVMKVRLAETLRHKEELTRKLQNSQEHIMEVEKKLKDLEEWKIKTSKELKDAKDKEDKAVKALEEAGQKHADRVKQVKTVCNRRLEECREQPQNSQEHIMEVEKKLKDLEEWKTKMSKELKDAKDKEDKAVKALEEAGQKHVDRVKQVETVCNRRLEECREQLQQEVSDAQNKWEDSEKKVQEKDAELQALRQHAAGGDQANTLLVNLRSNVFHFLRTLSNQEVDLDTMVTDPRSSQVDDIVQQVLDDNSQ